MTLVNENNLENVSGGKSVRDTVAFASFACAMCGIFVASSVLLVNDIKKVNRELEKYPEIDDRQIYEVAHVITIND